MTLDSNATNGWDLKQKNICGVLVSRSPPEKFIGLRALVNTTNAVCMKCSQAKSIGSGLCVWEMMFIEKKTLK